VKELFPDFLSQVRARLTITIPTTSRIRHATWSSRSRRNNICVGSERVFLNLEIVVTCGVCASFVKSSLHITIVHPLAGEVITREVPDV